MRQRVASARRQSWCPPGEIETNIISVVAVRPSSVCCRLPVGIMGLQWAKHLRGAVKVTINDISEVCVKMIKENCELNDIRVDGASRGPWGPDGEVKGVAIAGVEVTKMDANVIMHLRPFDYMQVCSATENSP